MCSTPNGLFNFYFWWLPLVVTSNQISRFKAQFCFRFNTLVACYAAFIKSPHCNIQSKLLHHRLWPKLTSKYLLTFKTLVAMHLSRRTFDNSILQLSKLPLFPFLHLPFFSSISIAVSFLQFCCSSKPSTKYSSYPWLLVMKFRRNNNITKIMSSKRLHFF